MISLNFFVYEIYDTFGVSSLGSGFLEKLKNFDVIFTVFGPLYVVGLKAINIVGFAQPFEDTGRSDILNKYAQAFSNT